MSEVENERLGRSSIRYKRCSIACFFTGGLCLVLAIALPFIFANIFWSTIKENVLLNHVNEDNWAHFPGKTELVIARNYTFYAPDNIYQTIFGGQRPQFRERRGFTFQQIQDYTNLKYENNNTTVLNDLELTFKEFSDTRPLEETVEVLNLAPLGFWHQLKNSDTATFALQSVSGLVFGLEEALEQSLLTQALVSTYFTNRTVALQNLCTLLPRPQAAAIYDDPIFGLGAHPQNWVSAMQDPVLLGQLGDYFGLDDSDLFDLNRTVSSWYAGLGQVILDYYYSNATQKNPMYLVGLQIGSSGVTNNPPPLGSVLPSLTVCDSNSSCLGYPEMYSFQKYILQSDQPITFAPQDLMRLFRHGDPANPIKDQDVLFHKGNMATLFGNGTLFEQGQPEALLAIQSQFKLPSKDHARVFWQWVNYVTFNFTGLANKGSNLKYLGLSSLATQGLYAVYSAATDMLLPFMLYKTVPPLMKAQGLNSCLDLALKQLTNPKRAALICSGWGIDSLETAKPLLALCRSKKGPQWQSRLDLGLNVPQLISFCSGFQEFIDAALMSISKAYDCNLSPSKVCTQFQIVLIQWLTSGITSNPLPEFGMPPATSLNDWFQWIPAFQLWHFVHTLYKGPPASISKQTAASLMDFDHLFSATAVNLLFSPSTVDIIDLFKGLNDQSIQLLRNYNRFVVMNVAFGGIVAKKTARQFLFGYTDPLLQTIRTQDPASGGDPSVDSVIHFNQQNHSITPQQFYTGEDDVALTRYLRQYLGERYTTVMQTVWTGNETITRNKNPYRQKDFFCGTDTFQNKPDQNRQRNVTFFVSNLYRWGEGQYNNSIDYYGLTCDVFLVADSMVANQTTNKNNSKYYQGLTGFFNFTAIMGAPVYISKRHMRSVDQAIRDKYDVWDEKHIFKIKASEQDESLIIVQPYTGVSFGATINLQANIWMQPDQLFPLSEPLMLPIYSIFRSGNLTQSTIKAQFGDVASALVIKATIVPLFAGLTVLMLLLGGAALYRSKKLAEQLQRNHPLLYSLQEQEEAAAKSKKVQE